MNGYRPERRPVHVRTLPASVVDAIDEAARAEGRSRENYLHRVLVEHAATLKRKAKR